MSQNNQRTTPQELAKSFMKNLSEQNVEGQRAFINEITEAITEPPKRIPEPVFRELFLPYFTGERSPDPENDAIAHWIGLVGSASEPADVVNGQGDVLFQVPPMMDTSRLDVTTRTEGGMSFSKVFEQYRDEASLHPSMGNRFLAEQLANKLSTNLSGPESADTKYSWRGMLDYYKLTPGSQENGKTPSSASDISDDDLDFE